MLVSFWISTVVCIQDKCKDLDCGNGVCQNGTCICYDGWQGHQCQYCGGKVKWVLIITKYHYDLKCGSTGFLIMNT